MSYTTLTRPGVDTPIKAWVSGVQMEREAEQQLFNTARLPIIFKHVAVMPDVHYGRGATVGSVVPTKSAIIPAAVGVDIGCVDADTEYLSPTGWRKISEYDGGSVMQYDADSGRGSYVVPQAFVVKEYNELLHFKTKYGIDQMLSPDHRVLCFQITGRDRQRKQVVMSAQSLADEHERLVQGAKVEFATTFTLAVEIGMPMSNSQIRVQVMTNADANLNHSAAVLRLKKARKIERARALLLDAGISSTLHEHDDGTTSIRYKPPLFDKNFTEFWSASYAQLLVITDECLHWDGNLKDRVFFSRNKASADFIQYAFTATGSRAVLRADPKGDSIDYRVFAHQNTRVGLAGVPKSAIERVPAPDGKAYCFTLPSGFWVMRRNGNIAMTGNCGMVAVKTSLTQNDLPESLAGLREAIEQAVPVGGPGTTGTWAETGRYGPPNSVFNIFRTAALDEGYAKILAKHPKIGGKVNTNLNQMGTLGGGNHFIEVCLDEAGDVWVMLHSGSRGVGNRIGEYFISLAREDMREHLRNLPDVDLAYLSEGTQHFTDYWEALQWAQRYASTNRAVMLESVLSAIRAWVAVPFTKLDLAVDCHHNYTALEEHFGEQVYVTRKGAVSAREGEYGIIPGSMGTRSYIVRGKGNPESFMSCSHGAGRAMSRGEAKRRFTVEDHIAATAGVECRKDAGVIDETPAAYKDIDAVIEAERDLVDVVATLRQVVCVKG